MRAGTLAALTSVPLLAAGSAFAANFQGEDAGPRLSVLQTIGIFVGIPVALFLVITFLVVLPGWIRGDRNRAEVGWDAKSVAKAQSGAVRDEAELKAGGESGEKAAAGSGTGGTGGASGSW